MSAVKPSNPKDAAAVDRLPLHLVPSTLEAYAALAFAEGDAKYGGYNWRAAGVRASVYHSAMRRHLAKWWNGEFADPKTGVPHLAYIIAGAGIVLDARLAGKLTDDRPPSAPVADLIDALAADVARVRALFAEAAPGAYRIASPDQQDEHVGAPPASPD